VDENVLSWQGNSYGFSGQPTYSTVYGYDALDDLSSVTQGTQSRSFMYLPMIKSSENNLRL
jgi:hypothetical protein